MDLTQPSYHLGRRKACELAFWNNIAKRDAVPLKLGGIPGASLEMDAIWGVSWRSPVAPAGRLPERSCRQTPSSSLPPPARGAVRSESGANRMFFFGTGFVGRYVSDRLKKEGWYDSLAPFLFLPRFFLVMLLQLSFDSRRLRIFSRFNILSCFSDMFVELKNLRS